MNKAIKKIELDLGGKMVSLTPQQAKNLKDALDDLFGERVIREVIRDVPQPYPILPLRPYWWEWHRDREPYYSTTGYVSGCGMDIGSSYCSDSSTLKLTG